MDGMTSIDKNIRFSQAINNNINAYIPLLLLSAGCVFKSYIGGPSHLSIERRNLAQRATVFTHSASQLSGRLRVTQLNM